MRNRLLHELYHRERVAGLSETRVVDNRPLDEKTPVTVADLSAGIHHVRLTKGEAYSPMKLEVEVKEGEVLELPKKSLVLKAVEVTFESSPLGAKVVLINDQKRGQVVDFVMAMDSELAPIVGQQITLSLSNGTTVGARIDLLRARAQVLRQ